MKHFKKSLLCILFGLIALLSCACQEQEQEASKDVPANPLEKEGYTLVFNDEFDGTEIDIDKWLPQYLPHATASAAGCTPTYKIEDGILHLMITEDTPFYSEGSTMKVSSIQTLSKNHLHPGAGNQITNVVPYESFATQYGYFEIRAKLPDCGGGGAAAWWMCGAQDDARADGTMSTQTGEIDIIEMLFEYSNVFDPKVHAWTDEELYEWREQVPLEGTYDDSYHIYAMNWTPEGLTFYVDGKEVAHTDQSPEYRMCMFLGIYATYSEQWSGVPNDVYPKDFCIDYVRVYKDNNGYPGGYTRPNDPVVLPEDSAVQLKAAWADLVANEDINNLAHIATVTTTAVDALGRDTATLFDGNYTTDFTSLDSPELPHEFLFTWNEPQSFKNVRVGSFFGAGQAPTFMELLAKTADGEWETKALVNVNWLDLNGNAEYVDIEVNVENATEFKLVVKNANLDWNHYSITEIQILGDVSADPSLKIDAKDVDSTITGSNLLNHAQSATMTTTATDALGRDGSLLFDGDFVTDFTSSDAPTLPHEFVLTWNEPVTFNTVRMVSLFGAGQGPTNIELYLPDANGEWVRAAKVKITWRGTSSTPEYADIPIAAENVTAFKMVITGAKLDWNHYAFTELQLIGTEINEDVTPPSDDPVPPVDEPDDPVPGDEVIGGDPSGVTDGKYATSAYLYVPSTMTQSLLGSAIDGKLTTSYASENTDFADGKEYLQLNWSSAIDINQVVLASQFCVGQAPTSWDVYVSADGSTGWTKVASSGTVEWAENDDVQSKVLDFETAEGIKGLRIVINSANTIWGHYCIYELEANLIEE